MFMDLKQSDYSSDNNATVLMYLNDTKIISSWLSLYRLSFYVMLIVSSLSESWHKVCCTNLLSEDSSCHKSTSLYKQCGGSKQGNKGSSRLLIIACS